MNIRIIARLDIKGPNLVKGIHLEGLRVLGTPEVFAKYYYQNGADELFYQDVVASLYDRNSLHDIITKTAKEIFIPLTVGGGIRNLEDISNVLRAGADKIAINTSAIKNPEFIKEASRKYGSSTIVVVIEAIKQNDGKYLAYTDNGRNHTGIEVTSWAKKVEELGAGEIVITSVDKEGTGSGFDIELTKEISAIVSIPVIAHGGCGKQEHISEAIISGKADAVAIASILHYNCLRADIELFKNSKEGNIEFLKNGNISSKVTPQNLTSIKKYLKDCGVDVRYNNEGARDERQKV